MLKAPASPAAKQLEPAAVLYCFQVLWCRDARRDLLFSQWIASISAACLSLQDQPVHARSGTQVADCDGFSKIHLHNAPPTLSIVEENHTVQCTVDDRTIQQLLRSVRLTGSVTNCHEYSRFSEHLQDGTDVRCGFLSCAD